MQTLSAYVGDPLVVAVGELLAHERLDVILHAQLVLHRIGLSSTLAIVGPSTDPVTARALQEHARDLGIPMCLMLGALGEDALAAVMRRADIVVTASEHRGSSPAVLEALAMGVPVIARDSGGLADTVGAGGMVLPADTGAVELAEAVSEVHADRRLAQELGAHGRRRADELVLDRNISAFLDELAEVI
nr:glycosyltransferase [Rhabdothermincola salaria]